MITKEDVMKFWRPDVPKDAIKALNNLVADLHEDLAWKEAYREVAKEYRKDWYKKMNIPYDHDPEIFKDVDAFARRIVEAKP